jgi:hypothetical protein
MVAAEFLGWGSGKKEVDGRWLSVKEEGGGTGQFGSASYFFPYNVESRVPK